VNKPAGTSGAIRAAQSVPLSLGMEYVIIPVAGQKKDALSE